MEKHYLTTQQAAEQLHVTTHTLLHNYFKTKQSVQPARTCMSKNGRKYYLWNENDIRSLTAPLGNHNDYVWARDAAVYLGVSPATLHQYVYAFNHLKPAGKQNNKNYFRKSELTAYLLSKKRKNGRGQLEESFVLSEN